VPLEAIGNTRSSWFTYAMAEDRVCHSGREVKSRAATLVEFTAAGTSYVFPMAG